MRTGLVKNRMLCCISAWLLFSSSHQKEEKNFPQYLLGECGQIPGGRFHNSVGTAMAESPGVFNSQICPPESQQSVGTVQVFLPQPWFLWRFLLMGLRSIKPRFPVFASNLGDSGLPCGLPSLKDPRKVVDF